MVSSLDFLTIILYAFHISPTCATCTTNIIFLDFNALIIFGARYAESAMPFLLKKKKSLLRTNFMTKVWIHLPTESLKFVNDKQETLKGTWVDNITMGHKETGLIWLMIQSKSRLL